MFETEKGNNNQIIEKQGNENQIIEKENQIIEDNNQTTNEQIMGNNTNNLEEIVIEKIKITLKNC